MFKVQGVHDEVPYLVQVDATDPDTPVSGSRRIQSMLEARNSELFAVTPTGPFWTLDLDDPATILGALSAWTTVTGVSGDSPQILPPPIEGAVY